MKSALTKFWQEEDGATAIEYGLIVGLISIAIVATLGLLGTGLNDLFVKIKNALPATTTTSTTTP